MSPSWAAIEGDAVVLVLVLVLVLVAGGMMQG